MAQKTDLDLDLEWPTFEQNDNYATYSPEDEREKIFSDFTLVTEDKKIRNKKRKPKKKRVLRLVSESEVYGRGKTCDRKKVIVISVLVACIIVIVAVCIFLGVYFGTMNKSSEDGNTAAIVDIATLSTSTSRVPPSTPNPTTPMVTPSPTTTTSKKPTTTTSTTTSTTQSTTTFTTTTSTTTTPTTTTTTTTTPAPTEPPTVEYTGSETEKERVINTTKECREKIIKTTDRLNSQQKCSLYSEMLRCVYIRLVSERLLVPVQVLDQTVEDNSFTIFPQWISIDIASCRDNGELDIRNMTSLPVTAEDICLSPDAALYYGKYVCNIMNNKDGILRALEEEKCRLLWGITDCVAMEMGCSHDDMVVLMEHDQLVQGLNLESVNQILCNEMYTTISLASSSPCQPLLYNYMSTIYSQCAKTITQGSKISTGHECTLFEAFFQCSYEQIPEVTRYRECTNEKDSLRQVAYDIASAAHKVDLTFPLVDVQGCIDTPEASTYICNSPDRLVVVLDSICYGEFRYMTTPATVCSYLSEYVYQCASEANTNLGLQCSEANIKDAIIAQSDTIKTNYGVNVEEQFKKPYCVVPPVA